MNAERQLSTREELNWSELKAHPLAERFPPMPDQELNELAIDIKQNSLREQIVLLDGKILDGRNRYNALRLASCHLGPENLREFDPKTDGDPVSFVISKNIQRRNLTTGQRSLIAAELYALLPQRSAGNPEFVKGHGGMSPQEREAKLQHGDRNVVSSSSAIAPELEKEEPPLKDERLKNIAHQMHVSVSSITKAAALTNKAPELAKEVKEGTKTLNKALTQADDDQRAGKPPKQKAPREFSAKEQKAITKIGQICGENIAKALQDPNLNISGRNIVRCAEQKNEVVIKHLAKYLIDERHWRFDDALRYAKEKAARELSPVEIECEELKERLGRICPAFYEAFDQHNSIQAKRDFVARVEKGLPLLLGQPRAGVSVPLTLDENGTAPPDWTQEVEDAIKRIAKECGAQFAQALRSHPVADILRFNELTPRTMQDCAPHIIEGWSVAKAMNYEEDKLNNAFSFLTKRKKP